MHRSSIAFLISDPWVSTEVCEENPKMNKFGDKKTAKGDPVLVLKNTDKGTVSPLFPEKGLQCLLLSTLSVNLNTV